MSIRSQKSKIYVIAFVVGPGIIQKNAGNVIKITA